MLFSLVQSVYYFVKTTLRGWFQSSNASYDWHEDVKWLIYEPLVADSSIPVQDRYLLLESKQE